MDCTSALVLCRLLIRGLFPYYSTHRSCYPSISATSGMMKHKFVTPTPSLASRGHGLSDASDDSGSVSSREGGVSGSDQHVARAVWQRYTTSDSDFNAARARAEENRTTMRKGSENRRRNSLQKAKEHNTSQYEEAAISQDDSSIQVPKQEESEVWGGLKRSHLLAMVVFLLVLLVLYIVLLVFTVKAAQCAGNLDVFVNEMSRKIK